MENKFNNIDEFIKFNYKNVEVPNEIFNEAYSNLNAKKTYNIPTYIKYIACISIIIVTLITSIVFLMNPSNIKNKLANNENNKNNTTNELNQNNYASEVKLPVASYTLNLNGSDNISNKFISPMGLDIIHKDSDCIAVVKLNKILYYTNYSEKVNLYSTVPLTVSNVSVEKIFKGSLEANLEIMSVGGVLSISDYEKSCQAEQIKKHGFDKMTQEEKETTYIEIANLITIKMPKLEESKYYLVYLKYNNNFEKYQVLDHFIYEYNIIDDTIRNIDTGKFEAFSYNY